MTEFKKQAIVWAITLVIAAGTIVSANHVVSVNKIAEDDLNERNSYTTNQNLESASLTTMQQEKEGEEELVMLFDVYNEDGTVIYAKDFEVTEKGEETKDDTEIVVEEPIISQSTIQDVVSESVELCMETESANTTNSWVDSKESALEVNSKAVEIISHDKENKVVTLDDGTSFSYIYGDIATTTAYCHCLEICCDHGNTNWYGKTCSGRNLLEEEEPKVLAADLSRYPIGTVLFVEGYGIAIVEDIGGKIDDRDLDVYISNHHDAEKWGIRTNQNVYVIAFGEWQ